MIRRPPRSTLFPTRRSSDLPGAAHPHLQHEDLGAGGGVEDLQRQPRSEEHTSELQSQSNLVCRLLLEKKKNIKTHKHYTNNNPDTLKTSDYRCTSHACVTLH